MKVFKKLLLPIAAIAAFAGNSHGMEKPKKHSYNFWEYCEKFTEKQVIEQNLVDEKTKEILDRDLPHVTGIDTKNLPKHILEKLDEYSFGLMRNSALEQHQLLIKYDVSRVLGSQLIKKCAAENNLDAVSAPIKKCYIDRRHNYEQTLIIVPKIQPSAKLFSLKQIQQLYRLAKLTGFQDFHAANIYNTDSGIAYAVDTEYKSFMNQYRIPSSHPLCSLVPGLEKLSEVPMESDAQKWIDKKIYKIKRKYSHANISELAMIALTACEALRAAL